MRVRRPNILSCLLKKGLAVAEEFVIAYMKMYHNVYFHKATRGVQHLVKDFLMEIDREHKDRPELNNCGIIKILSW